FRSLVQDDIEKLVPDAIALVHHSNQLLDFDDLGLRHRIQGVQDIGQEAASARSLRLEPLEPFPIDPDFSVRLQTLLKEPGAADHFLEEIAEDDFLLQHSEYLVDPVHAQLAALESADGVRSML